LPIGDIESRAQKYVTVQLAESSFMDLSSLLEDWILGLIRLWLTAYPEDIDLNFDPATGRRMGKKQGEIQIPLSRFGCRDCLWSETAPTRPWRSSWPWQVHFFVTEPTVPLSQSRGRAIS
jgi:hypothetical protein